MPYEDKTQEAFAKIEQGVKDVYKSENFKQYLSILSKFHNYSLNNTLLILSQNPHASLVAGYASWRDNFNRQVNKGAKAIQILAPYKVTITQDSPRFDRTGQVIQDDNGNPSIEEKDIEVIRFKAVNVFDISQTNGQPLPELVHSLSGTSGQIKAIIETVKEISQIPIEFRKPKDDIHLAEGARGYYSPVKDYIVVNGELEDLQIAKTLIHEYAHSLLHKQTDKEHDQREIEAESLAFVVCNYFGIDTSDYSFGYIASFANDDLDAMKKILNNIQGNAHEMIKKIEPVFQEKLKEFVKDEVIFDDDIAQNNYSVLKTFASPILSGEARYMKFSKASFMDLIIENLGDNQISISHYYELNGDLMADPDMEFSVDNEKKLIIPQSFQQDSLAFFESTDGNPNVINKLSNFTSDWLHNIQKAHYRIEKIYTEDQRYNIHENPKELKAFCDEHSISDIYKKEKEEKTR